jgi:hypothetical protein
VANWPSNLQLKQQAVAFQVGVAPGGQRGRVGSLRSHCCHCSKVQSPEGSPVVPAVDLGLHVPQHVSWLKDQGRSAVHSGSVG